MTSRTPETRRLTGITRIEIVVTIVIVLLCMGVVGLWPGWAFILLLVGWIIYPFQTADEFTIEWVSVATACIALVLFTVGLHQIGRWLAAAKSTESNPRSWRFRNSVQMVLLILFAFLAGTSMIGIVHQVTWLATAKERFFQPSLFERSNSRNNLRQIGLGFQNYHDAYDSFAISTFSRDGTAGHSWQTSLLPFLDSDQTQLFEKIYLDQPWTARINREYFEVPIDVYLNPGLGDFGSSVQGQPAVSHYSGNIQLLKPNQKSTLDSITDGASNTIVGGEVNSLFKAWGDPTNLRDPAEGINQSPSGFGSPFRGGGQFLFADGSVRFLSETIDPAILKALATPSGGEEISDDAY